MQCSRGGGPPGTVFSTVTFPWSSGTAAPLALGPGNQGQHRVDCAYLLTSTRQVESVRGVACSPASERQPEDEPPCGHQDCSTCLQALSGCSEAAGWSPPCVLVGAGGGGWRVQNWPHQCLSSGRVSTVSPPAAAFRSASEFPSYLV